MTHSNGNRSSSSRLEAVDQPCPQRVLRLRPEIPNRLQVLNEAHATTDAEKQPYLFSIFSC
jgi:hypothetical protein